MAIAIWNMLSVVEIIGYAMDLNALTCVKGKLVRQTKYVSKEFVIKNDTKNF